MSETPMADTTTPSITEAKSALQQQLEQHRQELLLQKQVQQKQKQPLYGPLKAPLSSATPQGNSNQHVQENHKHRNEKIENEDENTVSVVENPAICATITNVGVLCESENNSQESSGTHEDSDDFVLVPNNLPEDMINNADKQ